MTPWPHRRFLEDIGMGKVASDAHWSLTLGPYLGASLAHGQSTLPGNCSSRQPHSE